MMRPTPYIFLLLCSFVLMQLAHAQTATSIEVKVDRNAILIGEPIVLSLKADIPENAPIRFFRIDSLPHFEILDRGKIDTSNTGEGTSLRQELRITSYDSGSWVIPPIALQDAVVSDSIPVEVSYTPYNPEQPYHDIKDIINATVEEKKQMQWWWYAGGAALVLVIVFWLILRGKKQPAQAAPPPQRDILAEVINALAQLRNSKHGGKEWFTKLVDIFRLYADERKGISSQQQTSEDLLSQLRPLGMNNETYSQLAQALRLSDFVKFAKYEPTDQDRELSWQAVNNAIDQLEELR